MNGANPNINNDNSESVVNEEMDIFLEKTKEFILNDNK